ncbi:phage transcriptional regulator, ArpU family [Fontibacillus panacisegetis]|uniref:Phage transcriptional regulator, ArpU family n=1 Tax=Fontibacillus panacisegetis TaxID=670482 RepID=A0A1G7HWZ8_9BACL|nr:ArpU family phage packaging/lysis transcriptional regulator [Fontibacillus panacisegetis]SDF04873.1 phage transcriptional regulator, ArpU family [Fontibacillus panacisegetis]
MKSIDRLSAAVKKEIKRTLEELLERYHLSKYTLFKARESNITTSYSDRPNGPTNVISDPTARIAVYNVDEPARRKAFCEQVEQAVSQLPEKERFLITERYMQRDLPYDFVVYEMRMDPPIGDRTYDKMRTRAFTLLALMFGLEIEGLEQFYKKTI